MGHAMFDLPPPEPAIEITLATRGYSKGIAQTDEPQLVVRPEVKLGPVLLGGYVKNVTSPAFDGEGGGSVGYRFKLAGFDLTATAVVKTLLNPDPGVDSTALELVGGASRTLGPVNAKLSYAFSPDDTGGTRRSHYLEGSATYALGRGFTASVGGGLRRRIASPDYLTYNAGIGYKLSDRLNADLRWFGNDRGELGGFFKDRLVGSLRARF